MENNEQRAKSNEQQATSEKFHLKKRFRALSVMAVTDLLQLSPVRGKLIFSQFSDKDSMKHLLDLQVVINKASWHTSTRSQAKLKPSFL